MNRRNFIRVTGISISGLLITQKTHAGGNEETLMPLPDAVDVLFENQYIPLESRGHDVWRYKDTIVRFDHSADRLGISVQSPTLRLREIRVSWKRRLPANAIALGDHWERTYGDVRWQEVGSTRKMPWYCVIHDDGGTACFGVRTGCSTICSWTAAEDGLRLTLDTRTGGNGVRLGMRTLHAADVVTERRSGDENVFAAVRRFCARMCDGPRTTRQPVYGINDWYFAYGNNSADLILEHTGMMSPLAPDSANRPFSVIDAGWAVKSPLLKDDCCWGDDFTVSNQKFGDMGKLADKIKGLGMRPGLWTRPLCARHNDAKNLLMPPIPARDDPSMPFLDPTIEENVDRVRRMMRVYREWGFELVKHDYTTFDIMGRWGFQMMDGLTLSGWEFHDNSRTNAEIILHLYHAIREAAGEMCVIGCNTVSHLSAGLFELNRIGDDTSGKDWERTRKMGVNTMGFRMVQHRIFYAVDGDCVGLTTQVPWNRNKQWMDLLARSGAPLFISAEPAAVGKEQKEFIRTSFGQAAGDQPVGEPLDWLTNPWPSEWKLDGETVHFDWS